jgi:hypothetical protein
MTTSTAVFDYHAVANVSYCAIVEQQGFMIEFLSR